MSEQWKAALLEGIGTFILVFAGAGSVVLWAGAGPAGLVGIALAHGLALALAVSISGHISGGHINPAITIAFWLTRRIGIETAVRYIGAQLLGGIVAALAVWALFPPGMRDPAQVGVTAIGGATAQPPAHIIYQWQGMLIEMVGTFLLAMAVWGTAVHPKGPRQLAGYGIGLTLALVILATGPLTGASLNPARSLGPAVVSGFWDAHWIYWVGPILGAAIAALVYDRLSSGAEAAADEGKGKGKRKSRG